MMTCLKMSSAILFVLSIIFIPFSAYGATYYVDNSGSPACDDSYAGKEAQPWCTVSTSINKLSAGDILYIKNGTYEGRFTITSLTGTSVSPITIRAYPGHTPVLAGVAYTGGRTKFVDCNYLTIDGLTFTLMQQALFLDGGTNITVKNNTMHNIGNQAFSAHRGDSAAGASFITVDNNKIYDAGMGTENGEGMYIGTGSGGPVDDTNHITITNNTIYNTKDEGIELKPGTHDCLVENNILYNTGNYSAIEVDEEINGVQSYGANPNHIIRNNIIHDLTDLAPYAEAGIRAGTGVTVYNNILYNISASRSGILVDTAVGLGNYTRRIYHNTIDMGSTSAVTYRGTSTYDVKNNIGPPTTYNITSNNAYYVDHAARNYHLAVGTAPVDAGTTAGNILTYAPTDKSGIARPYGTAPDIGAYEYVSSKKPNPPQIISVE